jgi:hypothetical protein
MLSGPLTALPSPGPAVGPWGLQLANGLMCTSIQGAHHHFNRRIVDYYCGDPYGGPVVLHGIDLSRPIWLVRPQPTKPAGTQWGRPCPSPPGGTPSRSSAARE